MTASGAPTRSARPAHRELRHDPHRIPPHHDSAIEQEIRAKGLTAPRVTPDDIEANIASTHYFTAADGEQGRLMGEGHDPCGIPSNESICLLTFCVLVLRNGFHRHR